GLTRYAPYPSPYVRSPASWHPRCTPCRSCCRLPFLDLAQRRADLDVDLERGGGLVAGVLHLVADELHSLCQHLLANLAHERVVHGEQYPAPAVLLEPLVEPDECVQAGVRCERLH